MLQYERKGQVGSTVMRDVVRHPADVVAEDSQEILRQAGFSVCENLMLIPENMPCATQGGSRIQQINGRTALALDLWSEDEETGIKVGFSGAHDISRGILYMKMCAELSADSQGMERPTKSAITSLLDIADACRARKLTIGLGVEHTGSAEFLCSLLYLGFQVVPSRKCPLTACALLLDLEIGWPSTEVLSSTDNAGTCTGTSECSTSAEDELLQHGGDFSSDE